MSEEPHIKVERERDLQVRTVPCPTCAALAEEQCWAEDKDGNAMDLGRYSHTSRYLIAAEAGLVPPLGGHRG